MRRTWILMGIFAVGGCAAELAQVDRSDAAGPATLPADGGSRWRSMIPRDPVTTFRPQVNLSIFHLSVPVGGVSSNEAFWKHVDEQAVDVAAYDILYKNGLRVGRAPLAELDYLLRILDQNPMEAQPAVFVASGAKTIELPMKQSVRDQVLYDFDAHNVMTVHSYEECDNIFCVEFQQAPRKPGDVRLTFCPMVRTLRKRLIPIADTENREVEFVSPEKFFQLNLRTDVPVDSVLIIAPSPEARSEMSLGNAFLVHDGTTEKLEGVLLIVPQALAPRQPKPPESNPTSARKSAEH